MVVIFETYMPRRTSMSIFKNFRDESIFDDKEAVPKKCSIKKVFLKTSQNSQENTCVGVSILKKL